VTANLLAPGEIYQLCIGPEGKEAGIGQETSDLPWRDRSSQLRLRHHCTAGDGGLQRVCGQIGQRRLGSGMQSTRKGPRLVGQYAALHLFALSIYFRQSLRLQIPLASTSRGRIANKSASAGIDAGSRKRGLTFSRNFVYASFVFLLAIFPHLFQSDVTFGLGVLHFLRYESEDSFANLHLD